MTAAGSIRAARITDRQALVALSRQVHDSAEGYRRSLGVPARSAAPPRISLAALMPSWLPLRSPSVHLVAEWEGRLVGSCRAIEEPHRDDWVITELDAAASPMAGEVRYALLQAVIEEGAQRNVARYHAACADVPENMELFGQLSFMAYAHEEIWYRAPGGPPRRAGRHGRADGPGHRRPTRGTSSTCGRTPRRRRSPGSRATAPPTGSRSGTRRSSRAAASTRSSTSAT